MCSIHTPFQTFNKTMICKKKKKKKHEEENMARTKILLFTYIMPQCMYCKCIVFLLDLDDEEDISNP